ncbi:protein NRT1/ PTR FAMILY 1.2-like isoform X4 [Momordica charantia]|uniref:Protein NRT1/ PTR FAMILY 1.2-like isoform X4 n=1 Tax=Momordica charantia TaxID=3673 RepID=A0A6J1BRA8_MOMCH|nr:protein NRT1/ PTR FAMILY 1.2-like isoform X4 [Momordica charantia]
MEVVENEEKTGIAQSSSEGTHQASNCRTGGLRTMPFIIVNETFEKIASLGLTPNMVFYLRDDYGFQIAAASSILSLWSAASNALAIAGAVLADSYVGRFRSIILGSFSSFLGMALLWLTAMIPQLKPSSCSSSGILCDSANPYQLAILFTSLGFISIGAGCIRPCSIAFGADQLTNEKKPNNEGVLDTYFNWYYASSGIASVIALTLIVYIQDEFGWRTGFAVPAVLMLFSVLIFLVGSSLYVKVKPTQSLLTGLLQVIVVAFKNRRLSLPYSNYDQYYLGPDPKFLVPTDSMRCGHAGGLSPRLRMGIGLLLSCFAMAISAVVEGTRRRIATEEGLEDQPYAVIDMSVLWIVPQCVVLGVAEGFNAIGQIEYFYSQMPKTLSSVAVALYTVEMAVASLVGSALVQMVNGITGKGNETSWLDNNLNKGHLDYFYWLCAALALMNFVGYLLCNRTYGLSENRRCNESNEVQDFEYRKLPSS